MLLNRPLLNAVLFQLGWFCCVVGGDEAAFTATAVILFLHGWFFSVKNFEWFFILTVALLGLTVDSLFAFFNVLQFESVSLINTPLWLLCIWVLFAATLNHSLAWLQHRLYWAALLGGISGPLSYLAGSKLAGVQMLQPMILSLAVISLTWVLVMPLLLVLLRRAKLWN